jgi:hypothetical protein
MMKMTCGAGSLPLDATPVTLSVIAATLSSDVRAIVITRLMVSVMDEMLSATDRA